MLSEVEMGLCLTSSGGHDKRRPPKIKQTHSTRISNKYVAHGALFFKKMWWWCTGIVCIFLEALPKISMFLSRIVLSPGSVVFTAHVQMYSLHLHLVLEYNRGHKNMPVVVFAVLHISGKIIAKTIFLFFTGF
jgi:hypothetical protein